MTSSAITIPQKQTTNSNKMVTQLYHSRSNIMTTSSSNANENAPLASSTSDDDKKFDMKSWQDGGLTSFSQTCFAEYWETLPSNLIAVDSDANPDGEGTNNDMVIEVDPYNFKHRMALGKYIIEHTGGGDARGTATSGIAGSTSTPSSGIWGKGFTMHWYWGYLAQLDWQQRSGRLANPAARDTRQEGGTSKTAIDDGDEISVDSWFGYMNLNFSVAVYCGAANAGLIPKISCFSLNDTSDTASMDVENNQGFRECVDHWAAFWSGPHQELIAKYSLLEQEDLSEVEFDKKKDVLIRQLYDKLWDTHTQIIKSSLPHAKLMEDLMPPLDRKFGLGWCHMVELLAAMSWTLLSLDALMEIGAGYLPTITLTSQDALDRLKKNNENEYKAAINMINMSNSSPAQIAFQCGFFKRLAYWDSERKRMPVTVKILTTTAGGIIKKICVICRVLFFVILPRFSCLK
jgi:hypothetical protein